MLFNALWLTSISTCYRGDPDRMALWGQSAGSVSVNFFAYSYPHDPIVKGFIADSGAVTSEILTDTSGSNFSSVASMVGCGDLSAKREFRCMQKADAKAVQQAYSANPNVSFPSVWR